MNPTEQKQFDDLQQRLTCAERNVEETRFNLSSALNQSNDEARLYRNLFWVLLAIASVAAICGVLQG